MTRDCRFVQSEVGRWRDAECGRKARGSPGYYAVIARTPNAPTTPPRTAASRGRARQADVAGGNGSVRSDRPGPLQHARPPNALCSDRTRVRPRSAGADARLQPRSPSSLPVFGSFPRRDQRRWGECYLRGLMLDGRRKSVQPMAERLPDGNMQAGSAAVREPVAVGLAAGAAADRRAVVRGDPA
ncbi:transposase [Streptomyces olivaceoviridis]|uniref:transposase n=1 Tax=Streptomyces olivaceoviridis TaxID=1921 RepID=UPI00367EF3A6